MANSYSQLYKSFTYFLYHDRDRSSILNEAYAAGSCFVRNRLTRRRITTVNFILTPAEQVKIISKSFINNFLFDLPLEYFLPHRSIIQIVIINIRKGVDKKLLNNFGPAKIEGLNLNLLLELGLNFCVKLALIQLF